MSTDSDFTAAGKWRLSLQVNRDCLLVQLGICLKIKRHVFGMETDLPVIVCDYGIFRQKAVSRNSALTVYFIKMSTIRTK